MGFFFTYKKRNSLSTAYLHCKMTTLHLFALRNYQNSSHAIFSLPNMLYCLKASVWSLYVLFLFLFFSRVDSFKPRQGCCSSCGPCRGNQTLQLSLPDCSQNSPLHIPLSLQKSWVRMQTLMQQPVSATTALMKMEKLIVFPPWIARPELMG